MRLLDSESLARHLNLEHVGDVALLPTRTPPPPVRRAIRPMGCVPWGRTLGEPTGIAQGEHVYAN